MTFAVPVGVVEPSTGRTGTAFASTVPQSSSMNVTRAFAMLPAVATTLAESVTCAVVLFGPEVTTRVWPM